MYQYFHVRFKDDSDIYLVRVKVRINGIETENMEKARGIVRELFGEKDFEIAVATISNLLSRFVFIKDVAHAVISTF